jgi:hypothetical protein
VNELRYLQLKEIKVRVTMSASFHGCTCVEYFVWLFVSME